MFTNPLVPVKVQDEAPKAVPPQARPSNEEIAAWVLVGMLLLFVMIRHVAGAVIAGLAFYVTLDLVAQWISRHIPRLAVRTTAVILVALVGGGLVVGAAALSIAFLQRHVDAIPAMVRQMAEILRTTRLWLGGYGRQLIPDFMVDAENFKVGIVAWLKGHADAVKIAGGSVSAGLLHVVMGMLLAIVVFFRHVTHHDDLSRGPLAFHLVDKVDRVASSFSRILAAQIKVSVFNTFITAIYLMALMLVGKTVPFTTTLIVITFVLGLFPIFGNIVTNIVLIILSLGVSSGVAVAALIFVLALSKLQYVLTSRLVGDEIDSQAWEILFAIIIGEAAFGISGVVMAPIIYGFVKRELRERGLV